MQKTTNYNLNVVELNDAPPDITKIADNFPIIDAILKDHEDLFGSYVPIARLKSKGNATTPIYFDADGVAQTTKNFDNYVSKTESDVNVAINLLNSGQSIPVDDDYFISQYVGGGTSNTNFVRRPLVKLYDYIKSKTDLLYSTLGHTHNYLSLYGGTLNGNLSIKSNDATQTGLYLIDKNNNHTYKVYVGHTDVNGIAAWDTTVNTFSNFIAQEFIENGATLANKYQPKGNYAAFNHTHNYLPLSGGTLTGTLNIVLANNPDFVLKNTSSADVSLTFDRNNNASWKLLNSAGVLKFQNNWNGGKTNYFDCMTLNYETGDLNVKGTIKQNGTAVSLTGHTHSYIAQSAYSSAQSGYMKFSNGFQIVWGKSGINGTNPLTVTLPRAFANTNYVVLASSSTQSGYGDMRAWVVSATQAKFAAYGTASDAASFFYCAFGAGA